MIVHEPLWFLENFSAQQYSVTSCYGTNGVMPHSRRNVILVQLYFWTSYVFVALFCVCYIATVFSFRRESTNGTEFMNFLRKLPGNKALPFHSRYDVNIILISFGSAGVLSVTILLPAFNLRYDEGKLTSYDAVTHNAYLPKTIIRGA